MALTSTAHGAFYTTCSEKDICIICHLLRFRLGGRPILSAQSERETAQSINLPLYLGLFMALFIGRGRYKYVHFSASHLQPMLFAIDDDPEEAKNLATDPAYQTVLVR